MSLSDLAALGSFVSGVAVLISLAFLYFQLRQMNEQVRHSEKNRQANVREQRASRIVALNMGLATEPSLVMALAKIQTGAQDISSEQIRQCHLYGFALFSSFESLFLQLRDGLSTDRDFVHAVRRILQQPGYRAIWKRLRNAYGPEYAEFMDNILAQTPVVSPVVDPAEWLRDWGKEAALIGTAPPVESIAAR